MAKYEQPSRDVSVALQLGDVVVSWSAEGVSWNPTIARDMQDRCISMLREAITEAKLQGILVATSEVMFDDGEEYTDEEEADGE